MGEQAKPLAGVTICYVSVGEFSGVTRSLKQARTMSAAGARVIFLGWEHLMPLALVESGFETKAVVAPEPPAMRSSTLRFAPLRVLVNRTVNWFVNTQVNPRRGATLHRRMHVRLVSAIAETQANVVQAVDLTALESAQEAAHATDARLVYDSHELWYGFLDNSETFSDASWVESLLEVERTLIGEADLVLAVSDPMSQRLVDRYGIRDPLTIFNAPQDKVAGSKPVSAPVRLVFHGGLSADRNIDGLIRAMKHLEDVATLDIHGYARTIDAETLQKLIDELRLGDTVRLCGRFDYDHVIELLANYDIGVMAAKITEGNMEIALPNKLFDCICAGLAVAMNDSEAMREIIDANEFGITIDPESPETIARDLGALVRDPERIARMKAAAVEAAPRYWWPEQGRKLVEALRTILNLG